MPTTRDCHDLEDSGNYDPDDDNRNSLAVDWEMILRDYEIPQMETTDTYVLAPRSYGEAC